MEYLDEITQLREIARDAQIANKIMDSLRELRLGSYENSSRRWVWELIQNAKDVADDSKGVDINIDLNESTQTLKFQHNGKLFTMKNLIFLIEQVSTKERQAEKKDLEKTTGKFGTGFLTTNLLSEHVTVSGYMWNSGGQIKPFSVKIDRSGKNKEEIIVANQKSFQQLRDSIVMDDKEIILNDKEYNTTFTYELNERGIEVARKGIEDLNLSLPYVFAFVPEINIVNIKSSNRLFSRGNQIDKNSYRVQYINVNEEGKTNTRYIGMMYEDDVAVAVELEKDKSEAICFVEYPARIPKVFCDFPLIGTDDFAFPVIVNSPKFNPTEPRNGIYIKDLVNEESDENKKLLLKALELYIALLKYSSEKDYQRYYNVVKVRKPKEETWLSVSWIEKNIVKSLKQEIVKIPIVDTMSAEKRELEDWMGQPNIWIVHASSKEKREQLWYLLYAIERDRLPRQDEVHEWAKSLWNSDNSFELGDLLERVEGYGTIAALEDNLQYEGGVIKWLNNFYSLLDEDESLHSVIIKDRSVFPNQNGILCPKKELLRDMGIDEEYKNILALMGDRIRERLLLDKIDSGYLIDFPEYQYEDVFEEIKSQLADESIVEAEVYRELIVLYDTETKVTSARQELIEYANAILDSKLSDMKQVRRTSKELLEDVMKYICTDIADCVSDYGSVDVLELLGNVPSGSGKAWITKFVEYIRRMKYLNLLEKKTKPILPNQKGEFKPKEELYLEAEGLDEDLKDIADISGYDIREELLIQEIYLEFPQNREKSIKDVSTVITEFVRKNQGSREEEIRTTFRKLYLWINENQDKAAKYFHDVYTNKHWLYNDSEIAENMRKAESFDSLLQQYKISDLNSLEQILVEKVKEDIEVEKKEITEDILIESGITTEKMLKQAMETGYFAAQFIHKTDSNADKFQYVKSILKRSKDNILAFLGTKEEYNMDSITDVDDTISIVEKNEEEIYLIMRPSDYKQVIIYYDTEKDIMDYEKDWELWVEDGKSQPEKVTFGKMLKLTGINMIPLEKIR